MSWLARLKRWTGWPNQSDGRPVPVAQDSPEITSPLSSRALAAPRLAAQFNLQRLLGSGATAEVYLARDVRSGQQVALKLMSASRGTGQGLPPQNPGTRELQASRRLRHPDIAAILDAGQEGDVVWLAVEFAPGLPLSRYTQPSRLLPTELVLRLGARLAAALASAHQQGVVHRDLKPSNVLVDLPGMGLKLLDFGVARIDDGQQTRTGMTMGTPAYMAPEQLAGMPASPASDTYALGVLLFEMFTAQRPHGGASLGELLRQVAEAPPLSLATLRPDLPADVAAAVQQLLARDPAKRPADLAALARHLDALAAALPQRSMKAAGATGRHWP